jgi:uncharacterized protein (DUF2249 family)
MEDYINTNWWKYLEAPLQELMRQSMDLIDREKERLVNEKVLPYHDYSFVIFPAGKAYEGFLKELLLDLNMITKQQYYGEHFRIGRALSPNLPKRYRHGWVFGKLGQVCGGDVLPLLMWETWKRARNRTFHYFPDKNEWNSLEQAEGLVGEIIQTMERSLLGCKVDQV